MRANYKTKTELLLSKEKTDYYQLELDDMVIALHNKDDIIEKLKLQLNYALEVMGQIAKLSDNKVDAVQCANAIVVINEWGKE